MASVSLPGVHSWGNLHYSSVLGALGLSPCHGDGLRAPFLLGYEVNGIAAHTKPRVLASPFFPLLFQHDVLCKSRFLVRPRLLTRISAPSEKREL
jgi:hypothetical protein